MQRRLPDSAGRQTPRRRTREKGARIMIEPSSSTPRKAAAARVNGRKGGTKSPDISRWNDLTHACSAHKLSITEGQHLPEYGLYAALHAELIKSLGPGPISVEDRIAV